MHRTTKEREHMRVKKKKNKINYLGQTQQRKGLLKGR